TLRTSDSGERNPASAVAAPRAAATSERPARSLVCRISFICRCPWHILQPNPRERKPAGAMRELFDEAAGQSPIDPQELVRRQTRVPLRKRFYTNAGVGEADGGFSVTLDGRAI